VIGAVTIVVFVVALVARYVIHDEAKSPALGDGAVVHTRYESVMESRSIRGMSSGADTMFAVGDEGLIMRHRIGSTWDEDKSPTHAALHAVAQQLDEAIAVGDDGTIAELEGGQWRLTTSATKHTLRAVAYTSYGAIAAGDGGTILRRVATHEPWQLEPSGTTSDYHGVCAGLRDVWLVGRAGAIALRSPSGVWTAFPPISSASLYAVSCNDHAAVAVGERGTILERLDDVGWHSSASGVTTDLFAVSASIGTTSWLVAGAQGVMLRVSGTASADPTGIKWDLRAVSEGALGTWVGGERGILRRGAM